jgi:biotin carboxyl carrier protein
LKYLTKVNDKTFEIELGPNGEVKVNGEVHSVDFRQITTSLFSTLIDKNSVEAVVENQDGKYQILLRGDLYEVEVMDERQQRLMRTSEGMAVGQGELSIRSPMPGLIVDVRVKEGQTVEKGDSLCVLESMKMENEIKAPRAGTVGRVNVGKGDSVEQNKVLLTLG